MQLGIIVRWVNPVMKQVIELLRGQGYYVELINPDSTRFDLTNIRVEHDLYIIKSGTDAAFTLAGMLHALGANTLNPYPIVAQIRNKLISTTLLQKKGVPTPETYMVSDMNDLSPLLEDGPLILKPYCGSRGEGVNIVNHSNELDHLIYPRPILAQRYYKPDLAGMDHKVFCIDGQLFGILRRWPLPSYEHKKGEPFTLSKELEHIAYQVGKIFDIRLYGMDIIISAGKPYVVDVNKFSSFMGVPNGPQLIADYIHQEFMRLILEK